MDGSSEKDSSPSSAIHNHTKLTTGPCSVKPILIKKKFSHLASTDS